MQQKSYTNLLLFILSSCLFIGVCVKYFLLHEVSFENFIIGFMFAGALTIAYLFIYFYGVSSRDEIIKNQLHKRGDIALSIAGIAIGLLGIYKIFFSVCAPSDRHIYAMGGIFFFFAGILNLFFLIRIRNPTEKSG